MLEKEEGGKSERRSSPSLKGEYSIYIYIMMRDHLDYMLVQVKTNDEMFEAILYHLNKASNSGWILFFFCVIHLTFNCKAQIYLFFFLGAISGSSEAIISVFRPPHPDELLPGGNGGPRVWNSQLIRYSAYRTDDGKNTYIYTTLTRIRGRRTPTPPSSSPLVTNGL